MAISDRDCLCMALASPTGTRTVLLNPVSGKSLEIEGRYHIQFTEEGWAFIVRHHIDQTSQKMWFKDALPHASPAKNGDETYVFNDKHEVVRLSLRQQEHEAKYFQISAVRCPTDAARTCKIYTFSIHRDGQQMFWEVRNFQDCGATNANPPAMPKSSQCCGHPLQDHLRLALTDRHQSCWINSQWQVWMEWTSSSLALPSSGFIRSHQSAHYRAQSSSSGSSSNCNRRETVSVAEYATSTIVTLALLCRWSHTLKGQGKHNAAQILQELLECCLPDSLVALIVKGWGEIDTQHCWPKQWQDPAFEVTLQVRAVQLLPLAALCEEISHELQRSLGQTTQKRGSMPNPYDPVSVPYFILFYT